MELDRRDFLKTGTAMFVALGVPLSGQTGLTPLVDMTKFCTTESVRFDLSAPFVGRGFKWATDARILCRIPCSEPDTPSKRGGPPRAWELPFWNAAPPPAEFKEWPPERRLPYWDDCPKCDGFGYTIKRICKCGNCIACEERDGKVRGKKCDGCARFRAVLAPGAIPAKSLQHIYGQVVIHADYDTLIRHLPAPVKWWHPAITCRSDEEVAGWKVEEWPVVFRWNGGDGLICPLDPCVIQEGRDIWQNGANVTG